MEEISRSVRENFIASFRTLGLSTYAARVYVALLSNPGTSAGFLCNETGIPDSKIYYALSELSKKGMVAVQRGTPNIYKPIHPKEAMTNLKQQLMEDLDKRINQTDSLADMLSPIFESAENREELELAFVIRGRRNIVRKMSELISSARKEVIVFISEKDLLDELITSVKEAEERVKTRIAVAQKLSENRGLDELSQPRSLTCPCDMVVSDMKTLITVSSWKDEFAIMTNDKGLITMSREYYENPKCCVEVS